MQIKTKELLKALKAAQKLVPRRGPIPVLSMVRLGLGQKELLVSATDLHAWIHTWIKGTDGPENPVDVLCSPHDLAAAAKGFEAVQLTVSGGHLTVSAQGSSRELASLPVDEYPLAPNVQDCQKDERPEIKAPCAVLGQLLTLARPYVTTTDARYYLSGALLSQEAGVLHAYGTDGHRLVDASQSNNGPDSKVILPRLAVDTLPLLTVLDDSATLSVVNRLAQGQWCFVRSGCWEAAYRLQDGNFPAYAQALRHESHYRAELSVRPMLDALRRIPAGRKEAPVVRLTLAGGSLRLDGSNDGQAFSETLPLEYDGPSLTIGFNLGYLRDAFAALKQECAVLFVKDANHAGHVKLLGAHVVIMPCRL